MMARWLIPVVGLLLTVSVAVAGDAGPAAAPAVAPSADAPLAAPSADAPPPLEAAPAPKAAPTTPPATPAAEAAGDDGQKIVTKFIRDPALEEMRYQHLWIAYGAIWLIIFFFVFRTWRQGQHTAAEVADLKSRLAEMEADDGRE